MKNYRLNPANPGNGRLLYIDGDKHECDICDEVSELAVIDSIGGKDSRTILICKKCIQAILKEF